MTNKTIKIDVLEKGLRSKRKNPEQPNPPEPIEIKKTIAVSQNLQEKTE